MDQKVNIIMPVKDSIEIAEQAIRAIIASGHTLTVYNDYSTPENTLRLEQLAGELGFRLVNISEVLSHPSPNYLYVLQTAQAEANYDGAHLIIVESDVIVREQTIRRLTESVTPGTGLIAAVTTDDSGRVNFPYLYAEKWPQKDTLTNKRFSFCCTLLTQELLTAIDFHDLNPEKNWYDVTISHLSIQKGLNNLLMMTNPVLHKPHSSRPWKQLKYTNPLLYYWRKLTQRKDRI